MWARFCQKKMAGHRTLAVLLTLLGALLLGAGAQQIEVKLVGSEVIMVPKYTGNPSEINWKIDGNKLVDMEVTPPSAPIFYRPGNRTTIDKTNGRLTIRNLTIGDSGDYKAEVLVNSVYQYTEITLTVRACPDVPSITDQSTKDRIILFCESSTPGVTYEWRINKISVGTNQLYNESRPKEDVTLTCFVDNEVCKKNVSKTILYTPEPSGPSGGGIAGIVFVVIIVIVICLLLLLYFSRDEPRVVDFVRRVRNCFPWCKGNSTDVEGQPLLESSGCITVKFPEDQPKGIVNPRLTIHDVKPEDHGQYVLEVLQPNGEKHELDIKETDGIVIIGTEDDKVTLTVPDTEKVTKITLKKGGVTLFQWKVSDLKLHTNNITLEPGFVTVNNAEGNRSYKVEVHSTDNHITNHTLLEANNQGNESPTNREVAEMVPLAENGRSESQPIDSVTFHPINMTNKITWKKDGQPVNIDGKRMKSGPYGDLIINNVTPGDKGKYSVQCEDQKLAQEFILHL